MNTSRQSAGKVALDQLSWLGGFLDSDGSLGIHPKPEKRTVRYIPGIWINGICPQTFIHIDNLLKEHKIGHYLYCRRPRRGKLQYVIRVQGIKRCNTCLQTILPFIVIKREEANLMAEFIDSRLSKPHNSPYTERELEIVGKISDLKSERRPLGMDRKINKLAWLAGFVDGDGSIGIYRDHKHKLLPRLCIGTTSQATYEYLGELLNGLGLSVSKTYRKAKGKAPAYYSVSAVGSTRIKPFLTALLPYLITKRQEAQLTSKFIESRQLNKHRPYSNTELALVKKIKTIKQEREAPTTIR